MDIRSYLSHEPTGIFHPYRASRGHDESTEHFIRTASYGREAFGWTLVSTSSTEVAEALSLCGFEWLFIDVEHSVQDMAAAQHITQSVAPRTYGVISPAGQPCGKLQEGV